MLIYTSLLVFLVFNIKLYSQTRSLPYEIIRLNSF